MSVEGLASGLRFEGLPGGARVQGVQGHLAHKRPPNPQNSPGTLGIVLM